MKRRQDDGVTDGTRTQFAARNRREPAAKLGLADEPIEQLSSYTDVVTFTPAQAGVEDSPLTFIDVHPALDGTGQLILKGVREVDFTQLFDGRLTYGDTFALERFFERAYDAQLDFEDEDEDGPSMFDLVEVRVFARAAQSISRREAHQLLMENSAAGQLSSDESDLPEMYRQFREGHTVITDGRAFRHAEDITVERLDTAVALRSGEREFSDAQAIAIANRMDAETYPEWSAFGKTGVANKSRLHDELFTAYSNEWGRKRDWANMMFTYLLHGGDND